MNLWIKVGVIAAGGAAGALMRAFAAELVARSFSHRLVLATLAVNLLGCLLFGAAKGGVDAAGWGGPALRLFVFTGFLGAFTTFSTFEADLVGLWTAGQRTGAIAYVVASVGLGLGAFVLGWWSMSRACA